MLVSKIKMDLNPKRINDDMLMINW